MKPSKLIKSILMTILGIFWIGIGIWYIREGSVFNIILVILNGLIFLIFAWVNIDRRLYKIVEMTFLFVNALLTFTDQVGVVDFIYFAILILVIYLFVITQGDGTKIATKRK